MIFSLTPGSGSIEDGAEFGRLRQEFYLLPAAKVMRNK
jgi:hypothetical protein